MATTDLEPTLQSHSQFSSRVTRILMTGSQWQIIFCLVFFYGILIGGLFASLNAYYFYNTKETKTYQYILSTITATLISGIYTLCVLLSGIRTPQTFYRQLLLIIPAPLIGVFLVNAMSRCRILLYRRICSYSSENLPLGNHTPRNRGSNAALKSAMSSSKKKRTHRRNHQGSDSFLDIQIKKDGKTAKFIHTITNWIPSSSSSSKNFKNKQLSKDGLARSKSESHLFVDSL